MRRRNRNREELSAWPSFADVALAAALLMILYMVAQFAFSFETTALAREIEQRQNELGQELLREVPPERQAEVAVIPDGNLQRITFADQVLFDSGQAELKPSGEAILALVGRVLSRRSSLFKTIQIEGHTDDQPLLSRARFDSNWELSSARATSVVRFLQDECGIDPHLLSATGYAQYRPVERRDDDSARAKNRRVELVVVYSPQAIRDQALGKEGGAP